MDYGYVSGRLRTVSDSGIGAAGFLAKKRRGPEAFWTEAKPEPEGRGPQACGPSQFGYVLKSDLPSTTVSRAGGMTVLTGARGYAAAGRLRSVAYSRPGVGVVTSQGSPLFGSHPGFDPASGAPNNRGNPAPEDWIGNLWRP